MMPAPKIDIQVQNDLVQVRTPMNTYFVQRAKKLAGRWDPRSAAWVFDARIEDKVRALCIECYGNDGKTFQELVDIRISYPKGVGVCKGPVTAFGRIIGSAKGRYSGATLGNGVVLEKGKITSSGSVSSNTWAAVRPQVLRYAKRPANRFLPVAVTRPWFNTRSMRCTLPVRLAT